MPVNFVKRIRSNRAPIKSANLFDWVRPMHLMCRIFGMLPFKILHSSRGDILGHHFGPVDLIWLIVSIGIYLCGTFYFYQILGKNARRNTLLAILDRYNVFIDVNLMVFTIIFDMINRHRFIQILKQFIEFDRKVICLSITSHASHCAISIIIVRIVFLFFINYYNYIL